MGKLHIILLMISLFVASTLQNVVAKSDRDPEEIEKWFKKTKHAKQKVTKIHCYYHDIVSGKNPSAMKVAESNITNTSPSLFGLINMFDNRLTVGPKRSSKQIGKAQGLYAAASQTDLALLMVMNFVFTHGKYNGSTVTILARNAGMVEPLREMPIVGGTGMFRLARGFAIAKTHWFNMTTGDAVANYRYVASTGCIEPLCNLLIRSDSDIILVCLEAPENILRVGETEKDAGETNVYLQMIDGAGGWVKITELQNHEKAVITEKALEILKTYGVIDEDGDDSCDASTSCSDFGGSDPAAHSI